MSVLPRTYTDVIAWALLHFVWQGAALALLVRVLMEAVESPRVRYAVACVGLLSMAVAPILTMWWTASPQAVLISAAAATPAIAPNALASTGATNLDWTTWTVFAWLTGVACFSLHAAGGFGFVLWKLRAGRRPGPVTLLEQLGRISAVLGIRRPIRLFVSSKVSVPSVVGVVRPVILFPASIVAAMPAAQLELILAHELAHVARHDFLVNCLQVLVESALFYHPAVWWLSSRIRLERELCCDDVAIAVCGDGSAYARALLALEESRAGLRLVPAASGGDLRHRIARVLGRTRPERVGVGPRVLLVALALAGSASVRAMQEPPAPPAPLPPPPAATAPAATPVAPPRPPKPPRPAREALQPEPPAPPEMPEAEANLELERALRREDDEARRRTQYVNERFGGENTDRGRIYRIQGPPSEIESRPGNREVWRYTATGMEFEFNGSEYRMTRVRVNGIDYTNTPKQP